MTNTTELGGQLHDVMERAYKNLREIEELLESPLLLSREVRSALLQLRSQWARLAIPSLGQNLSQ